MPLPINPIIPIEFGDEVINAKASELLPWFTTGEQKAIYDLLKSYHSEDVFPALVQIEQWLNALQSDATKVPYTGAAADVDLGTHKLALDGLQLSLAPADPGTVEGRIVWNSTDGTIDVGLKGGNVTMQVGQEQFVRVVNKTGADLLEANYQCVKISGAEGQRLKVGLAQANNDANSADTIGLVTETILNNQEGFVTTSGIIRNINTTGSLQGETWADGDVLYLSGTTAGRITNIKPSAPIHTVIVGFVVYAHNNHGKIYVKVDNGYELDELHNVRINGVTNGQVLTYNNGLWENQTSGSGTVTSVSGTGGYGGLTLTGTVTSSGNLTLGGTPTGTWPVSVSGNAATVTNGVYTTGDQTIAGNKTFSSSIIGSITGNADTVDGYNIQVDGTGTDPNTIYFKTTGGVGPSATIWGDITGSIVDQTDLYNALVTGSYATGNWNINAASVDGYNVQVDGTGTDPNTIYFKTTGGAISVDWDDVSNTPTTLAGYGITDAYTETESDARFLGINATAVNSDKVDGYHVQVDGTGTDPNTIYLKTTGGTVSVDWVDVSGTPTTIAGYGIIDAYTTDEVDDLLIALNNAKANVATTLAGYGITDAYTKIESDARFLGISATAVNSDKVDGYNVQVDGSGTDPNTIYFKTTGGSIGVDWDDISNTPTTLAGYGISDAYTIDEVDDLVVALNNELNGKVGLTGDQTISGTKTFSSTITGSITGNAGTVTNGVYTSGDQTIGGNKTFSSTIIGSVSGNAGTVTNGVYTNGDQTIGGTKTFSSTISGSINGNANTVDGYHVQVDGTGTDPNTIYFKTTGGSVSVEWDDVSNTPTTLSGYGITDALSSSLKGANNGLAELDASGKVPAAQLPSYVDDVQEYANLAALPGTGVSGIIYVTIDNNKIYRWTGSAYIEIGPTAGNADTATKLATPRNIAITGDLAWNVNFDGSANVTATGTLANTGVSAGTYNNSATAITPFTVDAKGRVTGTGLAVTVTPAFSSITSKPTTLAGYGITDAVSSTGSAWQVTDHNSGSKKLWSGTQAQYTALTPQADTMYYITDASGSSSVAFADITGRPTTVSGYGITDAYTKTEVDTALGGKQASLGFTPYNATNPSNYISLASVTWTNLGGKPTTLAGFGITDAQALDADLTAIGALAGTTGFLKKTALNTWTLDTATYLTSVPAQTFASLTGKPTTLSGYGITDAYSSANPSNYITVASVTWTNLAGKPTTLSGFGITDAVTNNSNQSIAGAKTFTDTASFSKGGACVSFMAGATADHVYLEFYADSQSQSTRSGYFGFPGGGSTNMAYANQMTNGNIDFMTNGTGVVNVNGYQVLNANNFGTWAQPIDADLTAIGALAGATGLLRKTALNTWSLDTNTYLTSVPAQTWASITGKPTTIQDYGITNGVRTDVSTTMALGVVHTGKVNSNNPIASLPHGITGWETQGNGTGPAVMTFHRPGAYAGFFGLDTDNKWKVGGWSMGAVSYELLHAGNYDTFAPSKTGVGASGTWGISVTGNAATITGQANSATIPATVSVDANNIVRRTNEGYIYANHINFNTGVENPTIANFITDNGDGWSRKSSLAHVKNSIRGVADGTWGINITGNAGTVTDYNSGTKKLWSGTQAQYNALTPQADTMYYITDAAGSTTWASISGKPTTVSGYGITDAYTKTESDANYPTKTGGGASGNWSINAVSATYAPNGLAVGYRDVPLTAINTSATLAAADAGKGFYKTDTGAYTYYIPDGLADGTVFTIANIGSSGNVTVAMNGSETLRLAGTTTTGSRTIGPYGEGTFHRVGGVWLAGGQGVS